MRISDWSSDVCSSDLEPGGQEKTDEHEQQDAPRHPRERGQRHHREHDGGRLEVVAHRRQPDAAGLGCHAATPPQIGRASCREKVCKYVSISVVAVSFKKKPHNTDKHIINITEK